MVGGFARMGGLHILVAFFAIFLAVSLLVPVPVLPGSWFCSLLGIAVSDFVRILSALFNGAFYSVIFWTTFVGLGKKLE